MPPLLTRPFGAAKAVVAFGLRRVGARTEEDAAAKGASSRLPPGPLGKYDEALSALVVDRPGVTVAQAAEALDVPATRLYPVIRRLETRGVMVKLGRELHPR